MLLTSNGDAAPAYQETLKTEVLVLGGGGAGITSALTASENGKKGKNWIPRRSDHYFRRYCAGSQYNSTKRSRYHGQ